MENSSRSPTRFSSRAINWTKKTEKQKKRGWMRRDTFCGGCHPRDRTTWCCCVLCMSGDTRKFHSCFYECNTILWPVRPRDNGRLVEPAQLAGLEDPVSYTKKMKIKIGKKKKRRWTGTFKRERDTWMTKQEIQSHSTPSARGPIPPTRQRA